MKTFWPRRRSALVRRMLLSALAAALILRLLAVAAPARTFSAAAARWREEVNIPLSLVRFEMGSAETEESSLSFGASAALRFLPILNGSRSEAEQVWSSELQLPPEVGQDGEEQEGTVLTAPEQTPQTDGAADNGVPSRTLRVSDSAGYIVRGNVFINNGSSCALEAEQLAGEPQAKCGQEGAQVLIIHTHGSEAYTMPAGQEYTASDYCRTTEKEKNMVRVGDEIARVLTEAGLTVLHDRELYDYPNYSGAYNRSLEAIERYREQYPSLVYILDVHRDAVSDSAGNEYKLLCAEEPGAAQLEFVIGSSGGGLEHPNWRENLKLACAVQETIYARYPTLMRPITVRNSRYNQQVTTGSLLVEVGTAGNSLEEALAAARLFATGFAETVLAG